MPGMLFGFPFNEELFSYLWRNEPDAVTTAMVNSGAMQNNAEIAGLISNGSDLYTAPFYKTIGGEPANYDGKTDMPVAETEGGFQSGVVYGRMQGWKAKDFVVDYNSGAEPMNQIVSQVSNFWAKYRQAQLVRILTAIFGVAPGVGTDYEQWNEHTLDIKSSSGTIAASNKLGPTTIGDATVKACGDIAKGAFGLAIMHSTVANGLEGLQMLEFAKYTDPAGIERPMNIGFVNGMTAISFDGVPVDRSGTNPVYTSYVLGAGSVQYAQAPVEVPVEADRDAVKNGGEQMLYTRVRETMLPNGFSYKKEAADGPSPTDEMLGNKARYEIIYDPKCIAMARILSNG